MWHWPESAPAAKESRLSCTGGTEGNTKDAAAVSPGAGQRGRWGRALWLACLPALLALACAPNSAPAAPAPELPALQLQVRDFRAGKEAVPLAARKETRASSARYRAEDAGLGLVLQADCERLPDRALVDCVVRDLRGADRALTVRCGVPLDAV